MIIKTYKQVVNEAHDIGDIKEVAKFAWWPKRVGLQLIWLCKFTEVWEWTRRDRTYYFGARSITLPNIEWWDLIGIYITNNEK